ncbi:MAG TPA: GGDEF domain-containing protein, partial [Gammaproteobacteria bacterium]
MLFLKSIPYKTRLISLYVGTTTLGIILTLLAIYNASREQLILDHINNTHAIFSDRLKQIDSPPVTLEQLTSDLTSQKYIAIPLIQINKDPITVGDCTIHLSTSILGQNQMNDIGGMLTTDTCSFAWTTITRESANDALMILSLFDDSKIESILDAYTNRLIVPLIFFVWMAVWGSLMLGNLVKRLQLQKDEVEHIALHDALTGLPNRKYFSEKMDELINYSKRINSPFAIAVIDLNKFKNVNDEKGHRYGDFLLKQVAQRFKDSIRDYDVIARIGGDEFVLLLLGTDLESSLVMLERIYQNIIQDYMLIDTTVSIGASIGVSFFPDHG